MANEDIVITGIGMVTPLGTTAPVTGKAWSDGIPAPRKTLPEFAGTSLAQTEVAVLPEFDAAERLGGKRMLKYMSPAARLGCVAAQEAIDDAGLKERFAPERIGISAATGLTAANFDEVRPVVEESIGADGEFSINLLGSRGLSRANPLLSFRVLANIPVCLISIMQGIKGVNCIFNPWEGQTAAALIAAGSALKNHTADCMVTGAADNASDPAIVLYLRQAGLLGEDEYAASGAAYLVLERRSSAAKDGKFIYCAIDHMDLKAAADGLCDPLAGRMGRSFAAAPAILLALMAQQKEARFSICGVDRQRFRAELRSQP